MASRVIHFEISADDPGRAAEFYTKAFGWQIKKWGGPQDYWLATTGKEGEPGINGGIMQRMGPQPVVNTVDVPNFEEAAEKIVAAGGKLITQKMTVPAVGWMAYCMDTEGNQFGIMQQDDNAK
jgi:uncharacterized protein